MENQEKRERNATSLSALNGLTFLENLASGKMGKVKKSPDFPKPLRSNVTNSQRKIAISTDSAQKVVAFLTTTSKEPEMALHFVGKKKISALHKEFFQDPSPTDCITFPYHDPTFLGEVFVCPEVAQEYVERHGGRLEEEITLYIVHGFLHLLGFNDLEEKERAQMRAEEKKWMDKLVKNNLVIRMKV